jgi:serine/threonine-protein kinase HipA
MTNQLIALLDSREIGTVHYKDSRLSFAYSEAWRNDPNAYPLSLSMPLGSATHGHARIGAFLWGLLESDLVRLFSFVYRYRYQTYTPVGDETRLSMDTIVSVIQKKSI